MKVQILHLQSLLNEELCGQSGEKKKKKKEEVKARCRWLKPVNLATWKAEIHWQD
jgi:hypothetical protein